MDQQGLQGVILGRLLAGQDRQIELHHRHIEILLRIESKMDQRPPPPQGRTASIAEILSGIRSTAYAILPVAILALIVAGKLTLIEGLGVIRQLIPGMAGQ